MKTLKEKEGWLNKQIRKLYNFNYESLSETEAESAYQRERFDKNNLSEDDIDRICADI